jgi:hypothetical protein
VREEAESLKREAQREDQKLAGETFIGDKYRV